MGILELLLLLVLVAAIFGRGYLALGMIFDVFIALLVLGILYRLIVAIL